MGSVSRPWSSRKKSLLPASSVTVCWAKNSRVTRRAVASAATALAPFSQNSKVDAWLRSGQAQPGQSKPSPSPPPRSPLCRRARPLRLKGRRAMSVRSGCRRSWAFRFRLT